VRYPLPILVFLLCLSGGTKAQPKEVSALIARVNAAKTREVKRDICTRISDSLLGNQEFGAGFRFLQELNRQYATLPNDSFTPDLYNLTGNFYNSTANYNQSIEVFFKAIALYEKHKRQRGLCNTYTNLGNTYYYLGNYDKALEYYKLSMDLNNRFVHDEEINSNIYNNIGILYSIRKNYMMGLNFFKRAYRNYQLYHDSLSMGYSMNNFATILQEQGKIDSALYYFKESMRLKEKFGDKSEQVDAYSNMGSVLYYKGDLHQSLSYLERALALSDTSVYSLELKQLYRLYYQVHDKLGHLPQAFRYYKLSRAVGDTIDAHNKSSELLQREVRIEVGKTHLADSLVAAEDSRVRNLELVQRKKENSFLIISLCVAALIAALLYNRFRVTRKQKHIIAGQKVLVEQKQKEILDSIHYAKSIQRSLLTSEKYIERTLNRLKEKK